MARPRKGRHWLDRSLPLEASKEALAWDRYAASAGRRPLLVLVMALVLAVLLSVAAAINADSRFGQSAGLWIGAALMIPVGFGLAVCLQVKQVRAQRYTIKELGHASPLLPLVAVVGANLLLVQRSAPPASSVLLIPVAIGTLALAVSWYGVGMMALPRSRDCRRLLAACAVAIVACAWWPLSVDGEPYASLATVMLQQEPGPAVPLLMLWAVVLVAIIAFARDAERRRRWARAVIGAWFWLVIAALVLAPALAVASYYERFTDWWFGEPRRLRQQPLVLAGAVHIWLEVALFTLLVGWMAMMLLIAQPLAREHRLWRVRWRRDLRRDILKAGPGTLEYDLLELDAKRERGEIDDTTFRTESNRLLDRSADDDPADDVQQRPKGPLYAAPPGFVTLVAPRRGSPRHRAARATTGLAGVSLLLGIASTVPWLDRMAATERYEHALAELPADVREGDLRSRAPVIEPAEANACEHLLRFYDSVDHSALPKGWEGHRPWCDPIHDKHPFVTSPGRWFEPAYPSSFDYAGIWLLPEFRAWQSAVANWDLARYQLALGTTRGALILREPENTFGDWDYYSLRAWRLGHARRSPTRLLFDAAIVRRDVWITEGHRDKALRDWIDSYELACRFVTEDPTSSAAWLEFDVRAQLLNQLQAMLALVSPAFVLPHRDALSDALLDTPKIARPDRVVCVLDELLAWVYRRELRDPKPSRASLENANDYVDRIMTSRTRLLEDDWTRPADFATPGMHQVDIPMRIPISDHVLDLIRDSRTIELREQAIAWVLSWPVDTAPADGTTHVLSEGVRLTVTRLPGQVRIVARDPALGLEAIVCDLPFRGEE